MAALFRTVLLLILLAPGVLSAQYNFDHAELISTDNGLPTNEIGTVQKDANGFVWIATSEGLCRFDGKLIKVYKHQPDDSTSLLNNVVNDIRLFRGELWVANNCGISVLNTNTGTFRHYQLTLQGKAPKLGPEVNNYIRRFAIDQIGQLWVGTGIMGLFRYDATRDQFIPYSNAPGYPGMNPNVGDKRTILSIEPSKTNDSIIWAGTTAGLQEVNRITGVVKWHVIQGRDQNFMVAVNAFRKLYSNDNGLLYVGTWAAGIQVYDPVKQTVTPLPIKNVEARKMVLKGGSSFYRRNANQFWITTGAGVVLYDSEKQDAVYYRENVEVDQKYYGVQMIDEADRIWHINNNGLQYFDPVMQQFQVYRYDHLYGKNWAITVFACSDEKGNEIVACPNITNAFYHFNKKNQTWKQTDFPHPDRDNPYKIRGFTRYRDGSIFISTDRGLFRFFPGTKKWQKVPDPAITRFRRWSELLSDHSGNIWISADAEGLVRWNPETGAMRFYPLGPLAQLPSQQVGRFVHLYADEQDNIWFQRTEGFGVYVRKMDSVCSFPGNKSVYQYFKVVEGFAADKSGRVWLCGIDGWIGYLDSHAPERGLVKMIQTNSMGTTGKVESLATDPQGNVWGYTSTTVFRIVPERDTIVPFSFRYGMKNPDFFHFSFLPSGEMIFGGRNQIVLANPAGLRRNREKPQAYISEVQVLNQPYNLAAMGDGKALNLKHGQNYFSISFSARAYTIPGDVRFRYRLAGFDDWTETNGRRFANYTNVPGGDYVFELQTANNEGEWTNQLVKLPIHIHIPYWKKAWFQGLVIALLLLGAFCIYRYRVAAIRRKDKLRSEYEKKLANVEMSALLAQMNPHFLFNSLNSIDSYIIKNESTKASEYLNNFARLMRLILQNSRSNYISLKEELEALDLYLQMESLRFRDKFDYHIQVDEQLNTESIVLPPLLIQPYVENAIWHGLMHKQKGEKGKVDLQLSRKENVIHCVIEDNGIGRERALEIRASKHGPRRPSMGMQITRDRMEMINKLYNTTTNVQVTDLKDQENRAIGTRVELTIPI